MRVNLKSWAGLQAARNGLVNNHGLWNNRRSLSILKLFLKLLGQPIGVTHKAATSVPVADLVARKALGGFNTLASTQ